MRVSSKCTSKFKTTYILLNFMDDELKFDCFKLYILSKAVPLNAMEAIGGRGHIAPTH
jgi:hypothetical protein